MDWVLSRVQESPEPFDLLSRVIGLLRGKQFRNVASLCTSLLQLIIKWGKSQVQAGVDVLPAGCLLVNLKNRGLIQGEVAVLSNPKTSKGDRQLWIDFFRYSWLVDVPATAEAREAEVNAAFDLVNYPLKKNEVEQLGVNLAAWKLLVKFAPDHAIPLYGYSILKEGPAFANTLDDMQFELLRAKGIVPSKDELLQLWRKVIAESPPDRALKLAICLLKDSQEDRDIEQLKKAYHAADPFTRKQTSLRQQLSGLWKKFGRKLQQEVIDPGCSSSMAHSIRDLVPADVVKPGK